ncbi:hypothetical protein Calag_0966 [Caldisphaera lagunensis DSM 15908]|uniref:Damage-control phosphatase ARMT1-like metal-binding domain-containing protein n=1 Tax=Caldisphaera lagunensis (strain DSM 15908 / JCM 11604 / ANMR 0165 / IC-154) TaxID=1056495 RepID=L0AB95_CALLD|nr:ARMT1-like domain-containing protein [Caldisphaera lagunensis]AFZ70689.1 hypothetical protein Calag_0966 [Caldisphaera lagunensis DSM 15908]
MNMIDEKCKLCLIENRVKDLIRLKGGDKIPYLLKDLSYQLESNKDRDSLFVDSFNYIKKLIKDEDPYKELKMNLNKIGKEASLIVRKELIENNWNLDLALKFSASANIIDINVLGYEYVDLKDALHDEVKVYEKINLPKEKEIYLIFDNSGEVYIDLLLKESLIKNGYNVKTVIRKNSYEIDVTSDEIDADIIIDGNYSPIKKINEGFIIAKGIANLEAYLFSNKKIDTLHLFRAKCEVLAERFNVKKNTPIIISGKNLLNVLKINNLTFHK